VPKWQLHQASGPLDWSGEAAVALTATAKPGFAAAPDLSAKTATASGIRAVEPVGRSLDSHKGFRHYSHSIVAGGFDVMS
jgi:hypothetical protein